MRLVLRRAGNFSFTPGVLNEEGLGPIERLQSRGEHGNLTRLHFAAA
jgi:hypothetical protein